MGIRSMSFWTFTLRIPSSQIAQRVLILTVLATLKGFIVLINEANACFEEHELTSEYMVI